MPITHMSLADTITAIHTLKDLSDYDIQDECRELAITHVPLLESAGVKFREVASLIAYPGGFILTGDTEKSKLRIFFYNGGKVEIFADIAAESGLYRGQAMFDAELLTAAFSSDAIWQMSIQRAERSAVMAIPEGRRDLARHPSEAI